MGRADEELEKVAVLAEPLRRAIYLYVVAKRDEVGRDEAASAFGIGTSLAAFHLEKLLDAGLLEVGYRRLSGRAGPGAGRPAKLYRPAEDIRVTIPHRDYELAARLLVEATRRGDGERAVEEQAYAAGRAAAGERRGRGGTDEAARRRLKRTLQDRGYEPYVARGEIRLRNCPFHALAKEYRDTICPMNLALIRGILDGLNEGSFEALPHEIPGECCVVIRTAEQPGT